MNEQSPSLTAALQALHAEQANVVLATLKELDFHQCLPDKFEFHQALMVLYPQEPAMQLHSRWTKLLRKAKQQKPAETRTEIILEHFNSTHIHPPTQTQQEDLWQNVPQATKNALLEAGWDLIGRNDIAGHNARHATPATCQDARVLWKHIWANEPHALENAGLTPERFMTDFQDTTPENLEALKEDFQAQFEGYEPVSRPDWMFGPDPEYMEVAVEETGLEDSEVPSSKVLCELFSGLPVRKQKLIMGCVLYAATHFDFGIRRMETLGLNASAFQHPFALLQRLFRMATVRGLYVDGPLSLDDLQVHWVNDSEPSMVLGFMRHLAGEIQSKYDPELWWMPNESKVLKVVFDLAGLQPEGDEMQNP